MYLKTPTNSVEILLDDDHVDKQRSSSTETFALSTDTDTAELPITTVDSAEEKKKKPNAVASFLEAHKRAISITFKLIIHALIIVYFAFATKHYVTVTDGKYQR